MNSHKSSALRMGLPPTLRKRRKASTILLVLSILSLLILLSIMLTFTSRLEQAAAANFARGVQDRSSSLTGLPPLLPVLPIAIPPGAIGPLDLTLNEDVIEHRYEELGAGDSPLALLRQENRELLGLIANADPATPSSNSQTRMLNLISERSSGREPVQNTETRFGSNNQQADSATNDGTFMTTRPDENVQTGNEPQNQNGFDPETQRYSLPQPVQPLVVPDLATGFGGPLGVIGSEDLLPEVVTPTGELFMLDASALININTASYDQLLSALQIAAREFGLSYNAPAIADIIVSRRLGSDQAPGYAGVDDDFDTHRAVSPGKAFEQGQRSAFDSAFSDPSDIYFDALSPQRQEAIEEALENVREPVGNYNRAEIQGRYLARKTLLTGIDEYDEYVSDIRRPAYGDDVRITNLAELLEIPEIVNAGLSAEELKELNKVFTIFSASTRERIVAGEVVSLIDINRASAREIYRGLREVYPGKNDMLLRQFAVNIVDARDTDSVPTELAGSAGQPILGVERTPFISEVYADARTPVENGDDGQYVEIYNPWPEPMNVSGWRLTGAAINVVLNGEIPSQGYLIVTDDLDGSVLENNESDISGTGSFYDIFGVLPDGNRRRVIVANSFTLLDAGSSLTVSLENESGQVADQFVWSSTKQDEDSMYSYQRFNPIIREAIRETATPFNRLKDASLDSESLDRLAFSPQNGPFVSNVDVLTVFAGFADPLRNERVADKFPVIGTPGSPFPDVAADAADPNRLDARLVDIFHIYQEDLEPHATQREIKDQPLRSMRHLTADSLPDPDDLIDEDKDTRIRKPMIMTPRDRVLKLIAQSGNSPTEQNVSDHYLPEEVRMLSTEADAVGYHLARKSGVSPMTQFGLLNLNTAGPFALETLPGIDASIASRLVSRREEMIARARRGDMNDAILFHEFSDLFDDPDLLARHRTEADKLQALRTLLPHVTLNSRSFRIVSQPRVDMETNEQVQISKRMEGLVSIDRLIAELIYIREQY